MTNVSKDVTASVAALPAIAPGIASRLSRDIAGRTARQPDETRLVGLAQKGDGEAYANLVRRHQRRILSVALGILRRREDAEDVAQQVFLKAYLSLPRFDSRSALSTWLYKITVNECWDHLRRRRSRPQVLEAELTEAQAHALENAASEAGATSAADHIDMKKQVQRLLAQLDERDRQILILKEVEGFSVQEVSKFLDLNVNTVKVRLFRTRARLMQFRDQEHGNRAGIRRAASEPGWRQR